jgi:hypothetical protein
MSFFESLLVLLLAAILRLQVSRRLAISTIPPCSQPDRISRYQCGDQARNYHS